MAITTFIGLSDGLKTKKSPIRAGKRKIECFFSPLDGVHAACNQFGDAQNHANSVAPPTTLSTEFIALHVLREPPHPDTG